MKQKMPIGIDDFKEAIESYYVVDKTYFIKELVEQHKKVTLFTRPRRFGKTLTMSMLDYFFSRDHKDDGSLLFRNLYIAKEQDFCKKEQNKYPLIFMSLKDYAGSTWEETFSQFQLFIQIEFQKHRYLLETKLLEAEEQEQFKRFLNLTATVAEYQLSLWYLSSYLYRYTKVKPILLLDEYDVPLQNAYMNGFYDQAILFFRRWFSITLKGNEYLHFAVLTGVLRLAKESIFSGLNNLSVYSVLAEPYSDVFGFTAEEVQKMAADLGYSQNVPEIKQWYDGYQFGQTEIYNPWSVISYFDAKGKPAPYWVNTSNNSVLKTLLQHADEERIQSLQELIKGQSIRTAIDEGIIYHAMYTQDAALYTLLLSTGYLKALHSNTTNGLETYTVMIPNEEIKRIYRQEILTNLVDTININSFMKFQHALLHGDSRQVERELQYLLLKMASFYDTKSSEAFYHGWLLGMTCLLNGTDYQVLSNRESGYGRFDVAIIPQVHTLAGVIMEFKVAKDISSLEDKAEEALQQIEQKKYDVEFTTRHVENIWKYGIAFCGKHVKVLQG